jgi:hypothetical protein
MTDLRIEREFLAKAKRYGFKHLLSRKLLIPEIDESFNEILNKQKNMLRIAELNELKIKMMVLPQIMIIQKQYLMIGQQM